MRAARIWGYGGPEVLRVEEVPPPTSGPGQVMVEVHGSSVNPADIAVRNGYMQQFFPLTFPLTMGTDVAGIVTETGEGVVDVAPGDPVYGVAGVLMGGSGAFAEYAVTSADLLASPPTNVDLTAAAALPLAGISALEAVTERLEVQPGSRVLVHGAAGGVGLFAVALAKHLGAYVVATAHRAGVAALARLDVDEVVDTDATEPWTLGPFDLTLDLVGTDPLLPITVTKAGGRAIGLLSTPSPEAAAAKGITVALQATQITKDRLNRLRGYLESGVVTLHVAETFDLSEVGRALTVKEAGGVVGKLAIAMH